MKWHKYFWRQGQECRETGNQFIVSLPKIFKDIPPVQVIVCVPFQTYCHSEACFNKRKQEGVE